ncbi:hypothetical protein GS501_02310 [Saccharibacter sp. 17.LH.SD]|uniref:hypothetical protein n=1 Tax=Saccharibacter sp. 17.LH.SD TaxID=2689393 RepID=UPI00136FB8E2|nr:hypothetical protein [Saccharibacter sp. 17.LH.SD]MXV43885.1 hypothetical protein [Saccharibacter sp. 17.LH.SD]
MSHCLAQDGKAHHHIGMTRLSEEHCNEERAERGSDVLAEQAMDCILALLRRDRVALTRESASFLHFIEELWQRHDIAPHEVWQELEARIDLSEELLRQGIRARKGGRYRSTKLP